MQKVKFIGLHESIGYDNRFSVFHHAAWRFVDSNVTDSPSQLLPSQGSSENYELFISN